MQVEENSRSPSSQNDAQEHETTLAKGDHINVPSHPSLTNIMIKQGDQEVIFADKVLKFTGSGKIKCRILFITDFAIYLVDPDTGSLKRRIALAAVDKIFVSQLHDNFFSIIIPTEYDLLIASTRKNEIVHSIQTASDYELEVISCNRFEYNAASDLVKEIEFEEVEGGVKTRILRK